MPRRLSREWKVLSACEDRKIYTSLNRRLCSRRRRSAIPESEIIAFPRWNFPYIRIFLCFRISRVWRSFEIRSTRQSFQISIIFLPFSVQLVLGFSYLMPFFSVRCQFLFFLFSVRQLFAIGEKLSVLTCHLNNIANKLFKRHSHVENTRKALRIDTNVIHILKPTPLKPPLQTRIQNRTLIYESVHFSPAISPSAMGQYRSVSWPVHSSPSRQD